MTVIYDAAEVRFMERRRLAEFEHREVETRLSVRPSEAAGVSIEQVEAAAAEARRITQEALVGKAQAAKVSEPATVTEVAPAKGKVGRKKAEPVQGAPAVPAEPAKAATAAEADPLGLASEPAAPKVELPAPPANAKISDEDLIRASSEASKRLGSPGAVKELIATFGARRLGEIKPEQRNDFLTKLAALKK